MQTRFGRFMPNQYSITVSDDSHEILKELKRGGYKVSQVIDVAIKTLRYDALVRLENQRRHIKTLKEEQE